MVGVLGPPVIGLLMVLLSLLGSGVVVRSMLLTTPFEAWHGLLVAPGADRRRSWSGLLVCAAFAVPVPGRRPAVVPPPRLRRRRPAPGRAWPRLGRAVLVAASGSPRSSPSAPRSTGRGSPRSRLEGSVARDVPEPRRPAAGPASGTPTGPSRSAGSPFCKRESVVNGTGEGAGDDWVCQLYVNGPTLRGLVGDLPAHRPAERLLHGGGAATVIGPAAHPDRGRRVDAQPAVRVRRLHDRAVGLAVTAREATVPATAASATAPVPRVPVARGPRADRCRRHRPRRRSATSRRPRRRRRGSSLGGVACAPSGVVRRRGVDGQRLRRRGPLSRWSRTAPRGPPGRPSAPAQIGDSALALRWPARRPASCVAVGRQELPDAVLRLAVDRRPAALGVVERDVGWRRASGGGPAARDRRRSLAGVDCVATACMAVGDFTTRAGTGPRARASPGTAAGGRSAARPKLIGRSRRRSPSRTSLHVPDVLRRRRALSVRELFTAPRP